MYTARNYLSHTHHFLARHLFYPLLLSSILACGILFGRLYVTRSWQYYFLVWNLFLAWLPYLGSLWAASIQRRYPHHWWRLLLPGGFWLLFLPNAPYILTDFVHLQHQTFLWWYDTGLLLAFAWTGCFLAVASLQSMQTLVEHFAGRVAGWLLVLGSVGLSGVGMYLGRFLRWNSWDLLLNPRAVLSDVTAIMLNPFNHLHTCAVTGMFAMLLLICYITFTTARRPVK
ncbi:MAG: DUF1361 domain-containing protein [Chloroflexaceae bacterium]